MMRVTVMTWNTVTGKEVVLCRIPRAVPTPLEAVPITIVTISTCAGSSDACSIDTAKGARSSAWLTVETHPGGFAAPVM